MWSTLKKNISAKTFWQIVAISVVPVALLITPFALGLEQFLFLTIPEGGMLNILRNWDGPHYIVVARSFYNPDIIRNILFTDVPPAYYPAHFPLYPIFIALAAPVFGFFYSGLFITLVFGVILNVSFYIVAKKFTKHPLLLTFVFTVFPPRFLVTRSILAPETLMVFLIFMSLVFWEKREYFKSSVFGALGILSKVKAGFLVPAFAADVAEEFLTRRKFSFATLWAALIPAALGLLFGFYYLRTGDFFAFFTAEQGNELFLTYPFAQFNAEGVWTQTAWLEDVVFYFLAIFLLVVALYRSGKHRSWFYYAVFYGTFLIFVPQRDITRFSYPLYPFFLLVFEKYFVSKTFKWALILALPAIYFFALNFMIQNQAPVADPGKLLGFY